MEYQRLKGGDLMKWSFLCGEMSQSSGKIFQLFGNVAGEMQVSDIPLAPSVDIEALKQGDDDPLEVVVEIPASKSKRGWNYTANSLKNIVDAVNTRTLNGFLGHQRPEDVSNQFLPPATHWVGAKMVGEVAYFRGVVDAAAKDLKRWIKSGRIKQVSIFGRPKLQNVAGETNVVAYDPMSIDWTPLDRAGMDTSIVAMSGEMWDLDGNGPNENKGGNNNMNPEELLKELKKMAENRQVNMSMIAGEMGLTVEQIAGELDSDWLKKMNTAVEQLTKVNKALGISGEMDIVQVAEEAAKALDKVEKMKFDKVVGEMMETKITSEQVRKDIADPSTAIGKMWDYHSKGITADMTKEQIAGEMDSFLNDDAVKGIIDNYHTDNSVIKKFNNNSNNSSSSLKTKKVSL